MALRLAPAAKARKAAAAGTTITATIDSQYGVDAFPADGDGGKGGGGKGAGGGHGGGGAPLEAEDTAYPAGDAENGDGKGGAAPRV